MRWCWLGLFLVAACGDNLAADAPEVTPADDLIIVAHPDDDLVFMEPDLAEILGRGGPLTTVYVTGGDGGNGLPEVESRTAALQAAYGIAAGSRAWTCGWIEVAGHAAHHCRLDDRAISLIVIGYPDGGVNADRPGSLLRLFDGAIDHADTIAESPASYTREGLVDALASIITIARPRTIRTLDIGVTHGPDHPDHQLVGTLAVLARAAASSDAELLSYRGYNINGEPANIPGALADEASLPMRAYEACVLGCGVCGRDVCPTLTDPRYAEFVQRHYALGARGPLTAMLRSEDGCAQVTAGPAIAIGPCETATPLTFEPNGTILLAGRCLDVAPDGSVVTADTCGRFLADDEGHLWAGVLPDPETVTKTAHAMCVGPADGMLRIDTCGVDRDPRWRLERPAVTSTRRALGVFATGRRLRLADMTGDGHADLCTIVGGRLSCAAGDGQGGFARSTNIDAPPDTLSIDPDTLALGDIDGDGRADACGRDAVGIMCATAASGFRAHRWQTALPATTLPSTLSIDDRQLCALGEGGPACVSLGATVPDLLSAWPRTPEVQFGDLDGDGAADWCAFVDAGPACGLSADRDVTIEGLPWGYAAGGVVDGSTAMDGTVGMPLRALGDVDGDGRADLCELVDDRVMCAVSQGDGFRPRTIWMDLPPASGAKALWLGDLDGDHKLDPCVGTDDAVICALSP